MARGQLHFGWQIYLLDNPLLREPLRIEHVKPRQAIELFVYRAVREAGSLIAALGGLDVLVFTGGIGENSALVRRMIGEGLAWAL